MPTFVLPFPAINPVLVQWGPLAIRWYALAYIAGLVLGWSVIRRVVANDRFWGGAKRPSRDSIDDLLVYCAFGVIIGGRLGNVLFYDPQYYFAHPLDILKVWEGGMAFHGGLIGSLLGIALFARRYHTPLLTVSTSARWSRRSACSSAGSPISSGPSYGADRPTSPGRWCFPGTDGLPRHPSQIYEALLEGVLAFRHPFCARPPRRAAEARADRRALSAFSMARRASFSEFFREPDPRLEDLGRGLTMGMLLSAPMIVIGLGLIAVSLGRRGS